MPLEDVAITEIDPLQRAKAVARSGVEVLICGALSWPLEMALVSVGVEVIPNVCGKVEEVLTAFLTERLDQGSFWMPGCCGWRRGLRTYGRSQSGRGRRRRPPGRRRGNDAGR